MLANVFTRTLTERSRTTLVYAIALGLLAAMYVGVYPSIADQMGGYVESLPEALTAFIGADYTTPQGYLHSTIFTVLGPLLLVGAAVTYGASAIAGEESDHTLALVLSTPVSRVRLAWQKLAALCLALTLVAIALLAVLVALSTALDLDLPAGDVAAATLHLHALALFACGIAFGVGAATGTKVAGQTVAAGIVVLGFVLAGVAGLVDGLDWVRAVSPFHWFNGNQPIANGVSWGHLALLYGFGAAAAAAGTAVFDRRDLR